MRLYDQDRRPTADSSIIHDSSLQAIPAEASNAKLFGKRCTTRITAGEYNEALQDAKTLVKLLPDAPIVSPSTGTLGASRSELGLRACSCL